jgi:hypothetical protein
MAAAGSLVQSSAQPILPGFMVHSSSVFSGVLMAASLPRFPAAAK